MSEKSNSRPGVMIYFDKVAPFLAKMDDEQAGLFFRGILEYAEHGVVPALDLVGELAFDVLRPLIDRDEEKYQATVLKRRYATYCRETEKASKVPMPFDAWNEYFGTSDNIM